MRADMKYTMPKNLEFTDDMPAEMKRAISLLELAGGCDQVVYLLNQIADKDWIYDEARKQGVSVEEMRSNLFPPNLDF